MVLGANEIVLIPKGSLIHMINSMIDGVIIANYLGLPVSMIWTHEKVQYDMLFLNNIQLVDYSYLRGKNYLYNPDLEEIKIMVNSLEKSAEQNIVVVETQSMLKLERMPVLEYYMKRKSCYNELCKERISGSLLGQINMIPFPKRPFLYTGSEKLYKNAFTFNLDTSEVIISKEDVMYYVRVLAASRSDLLICEDEKELPFFIEAASVNMVCLVIRKIDKETVRKALESKQLLELSVENFSNEETVLFPNTQQMYFCL